jgi:inosose dehydratase
MTAGPGDLLIGNAPCSWGVAYPTGNGVTWSQYLDEVAAAGYRATELGPLGFLPRDPEVLVRELDRRGLTVVGATHVHTFGDTRTAPDLMSTLREFGPLLSRLGARHLVVMDESNWYPEGQEGVLDAEGWGGLVRTVREAQALIEEDLGLKASFHPHIGTAVEREAQIDRLLGETSIDLCFDTGHHAAWGQDPLAYMRKVRDRIVYVHLKNVDAAVRRRLLSGEITVAGSYGAGLMAPLPDGAVDIAAVVRFLRETGFDGPVVVEQDLSDDAPESPGALAARNLSYLERLA